MRAWLWGVLLIALSAGSGLLLGLWLEGMALAVMALLVGCLLGMPLGLIAYRAHLAARR